MAASHPPPTHTHTHIHTKVASPLCSPGVSGAAADPLAGSRAAPDADRGCCVTCDSAGHLNNETRTDLDVDSAAHGAKLGGIPYRSHSISAVVGAWRINVEVVVFVMMIHLSFMAVEFAVPSAMCRVVVVAWCLRATEAERGQAELLD